MVAHVCHGQFFYIDDQESKYWLQTNFSSFNKSDIFPSNKWLTYGINKNIRQKEGHSFGATEQNPTKLQLDTFFQGYSSERVT